MSDGEDWRSVALGLQEQLDALGVKLREEATLRRQRDEELYALLAHVLSDQYHARGRLDAEEDEHARMSDQELGRARLVAGLLEQSVDGSQAAYGRLRRVV